jgi:hypothetical protein
MPTGPASGRPDDRLRIEPGISRFRVRVFDAPRNDEGLSDIRKARRALVDIGADRLELIGPTHQFHLLDGFGQ